MRVCIITNPNAGSAHLHDELAALVAGHPDYCIRSSAEDDSAQQTAEQAAREGFEVVAAAGGDGTINQVVNGLMASGADACLGVLPTGTGNDLARSLALPPDIRDAAALLDCGRRARIDVIQVEAAGLPRRYGVNACAGGFSGAVDEKMTPELKSRWGPFSYLIGAASALPEMEHYRTIMRYDEGEDEIVQALNIVVANGKTVAGGKRVAPLACMDDGLLDVVVIRRGTVVELADVGARFVAGNYLESQLVHYRPARQVRITTEPGMWFNVDGELHTDAATVVFTALPKRLEVIVGNGFEAGARCENDASVPSSAA